jgi:glycosyltransferase involved in cell wall biosynthesis
MVVPKISVIIPAHNEESYIKKTLHSLKQQTYQNFEVIVVTNGCTDQTEQVMQKRVNDKIKHYNLNVANVSRARNFGAGKANGDLLVFLDADTTLEEDALQKIKENFLNHHGVATTKAYPEPKSLKYNLLMGFKNFYNSTFYKGCSGVLICRRDHFDQVNGYNSELTVKEHRDLTNRLLNHGKYTCLNVCATTSMRRYDQWGAIKLGLFWINQWAKAKLGGNLKDSKYEKIR